MIRSRWHRLLLVAALAWFALGGPLYTLSIAAAATSGGMAMMAGCNGCDDESGDGELCPPAACLVCPPILLPDAVNLPADEPAAMSVPADEHGTGTGVRTPVPPPRMLLRV